MCVSIRHTLSESLVKLWCYQTQMSFIFVIFFQTYVNVFALPKHRVSKIKNWVTLGHTKINQTHNLRRFGEVTILQTWIVVNYAWKNAKKNTNAVNFCDIFFRHRQSCRSTQAKRLRNSATLGKTRIVTVLLDISGLYLSWCRL